MRRRTRTEIVFTVAKRLLYDNVPSELSLEEVWKEDEGTRIEYTQKARGIVDLIYRKADLSVTGVCLCEREGIFNLVQHKRCSTCGGERGR